MNGHEPGKTQLLKQIENWGFYLLPKSHQHGLGHTGLLVAIREHPTGAHYDPETIRVRILDEEGVPEWTTLGLEWRFPTSCRVCAGRVILNDRSKKVIEFFTFGGYLESFAVLGEVVYSLRSPAPIIQVVGKMETAADAFVFETEVLIGKLHARWGMDDASFDRRMSQVDPLQLYVASVHAILSQLKHTPSLREDLAELDRLLSKEKNLLRETNQWLANPPTFEELLGPS